MLRKYERELKSLREELQKSKQNVVDKRALLELENQKKQVRPDVRRQSKS